MQNIHVQLEDSGGVVTKHLEINFADVYVRFMEILDRETKYPWVDSIDEYGDTLFNYKQIPHIISELKRISLEPVSADAMGLINKLIEDIQNVEPHEYVRLVGD